MKRKYQKPLVTDMVVSSATLLAVSGEEKIIQIFTDTEAAIDYGMD